MYLKEMRMQEEQRRIEEEQQREVADREMQFRVEQVWSIYC